MAEPASSKLWLTRAFAWLGGTWAFMSPARTARLLHGFAHTEAQSQLELCQAAACCPDVARRALYLRHSLDEARHARAFAEQASGLAVAAGAAGFSRPFAGSEDLYERLGEARFLAFVYQGERRGRTQFEVYASILHARGADALARLFEQLVQDERQHEAYTLRLLRELAANDEAGRALRWVTRWNAWRTFRRNGRRLAGALYGVSMLLLYVALSPYALLFRLLTKPRRGFSTDG